MTNATTTAASRTVYTFISSIHFGNKQLHFYYFKLNISSNYFFLSSTADNNTTVFLCNKPLCQVSCSPLLDFRVLFVGCFFFWTDYTHTTPLCLLSSAYYSCFPAKTSHTFILLHFPKLDTIILLKPSPFKVQHNISVMFYTEHFHLNNPKAKWPLTPYE